MYIKTFKTSNDVSLKYNLSGRKTISCGISL